MLFNTEFLDFESQKLTSGMNKAKTVKKNGKNKNQLVFKIITVFIPILILLMLEGVLRLAGYGDNLHLFIQNPVPGYEQYMIVNPVIGKKYFQKLEYSAPANDIFLREKPENTFRIFVMGSSTVYGFPYDRNLMFSRILHKELEDAYPNKKIEVVNTSITAINSFTLLDYTDQILKYEPDAILIYAGHNEFYGAFGIGSNETMSRNRGLTRLHIALLDYKIYQLLRNIISGVSGRMAGKNEVHGTLMKRIVADKDILLHSQAYNIAMERYKQNMDEIVRKITKRKVPVFLSEVISNVEGMEPFNSVAGDSLEAAIDVFNRAKSAAQNGDYKTALDLYYKAKDLDCIRFRASEDINKIIHELIDEYHLHRIPMLSVFQSQSPNGFIGNKLMTEHVHPNIAGNFLMAEAFFNGIAESGILGEENKSHHFSTDYYKRNWGYTALDSLYAVHAVNLLKGFWPFVLNPEKEYNYKQLYKPKTYLDSLAFEVVGNHDLILSDVRVQLAKNYEKSGQIEKAFREYDALLRTNPYVALNYRDAASCLLQLSDLPLALKYFKKSLEYEDSYFARFRIGEIYLMKGDYDHAIESFEKAFPLTPDDMKVNVLAKTYQAFLYANKTGQAQQAAEELKRVKANQFLQIAPKSYVYSNYIPFQTKEEVSKAKELIAENKNDEALQVLESSLQIYDSHIANRLIGEIYKSRKNNKKAIFYYNKVYDEFKFDPSFLNDFILISVAGNDISNAKKALADLKKTDPKNNNLGVLDMLISQSN